MAIYANIVLPDGARQRVGPLAVGQTEESYRNIVEQAGYRVLSFEHNNDFVPSPVFSPTVVPGGAGEGRPGYLVPDPHIPGMLTISATPPPPPQQLIASGEPPSKAVMLGVALLIVWALY